MAPGRIARETLDLVGSREDGLQDSCLPANALPRLFLGSRPVFWRKCERVTVPVTSVTNFLKTFVAVAGEHRLPSQGTRLAPLSSVGTAVYSGFLH